MRPFIEAFVTGRFSLMLISIVAMFFVVPLVGGDQSVIDKVVGWFSIAVLISCLRAIARTRGFFIFMTVLTLINILMSGSEIIMQDDSQSFRLAVLGFRIIYYVLVFLSIMRFVLNRDPVNGDKICGAISAYLLMGMIWSFVYSIFFIMDDTCISVPQVWLDPETVTINSFWSIYFSFTTLTTLGYGDVTPQTPLTQSYAVMQAAIGQIFLAVIVARLIALHITHGRDEHDEA